MAITILKKTKIENQSKNWAEGKIWKIDLNLSVAFVELDVELSILYCQISSVRSRSVRTFGPKFSYAS